MYRHLSLLQMCACTVPLRAGRWRRGDLKRWRACAEKKQRRMMASSAATRTGAAAAKVVKPIFSRDLNEARRRVRELYRAWYREVPNAGTARAHSAKHTHRSASRSDTPQLLMITQTITGIYREILTVTQLNTQTLGLTTKHSLFLWFNSSVCLNEPR